MALFKPLWGKRESLPTTKHEGYAYFCTDDKTFHIDYKDANGDLQRDQINANDAQTLSGASLSTSIKSTDSEIPTSKAVKTALDSHKHTEYINQNAFSNVQVGDVIVAADSKEDMLVFESGSNVTITINDSNGNISISAKDTTYQTGTVSKSGLTKLYTETGTNTDGTMTQNAINSALGAKQNVINGAASTITGSNLTASRALISNSSGKVAVSDITSTELSCLDNVTSNIQTQLNNKSNTGHTHTGNDVILTDTSTSVQYKLCITDGKLNIVKI